jgi:hypothetical protein
MHLFHTITQFVLPRKWPPSHCIAPHAAVHLAPECWPVIRVCPVVVPAEIIPPSECFVLALETRASEDVVRRPGLVGDVTNYFVRLYL